MKATDKPSFGVLVTDVTRLMRKHFDRRAVCFNLTRAQWRALKRLHRGEGMRQNELAEQLEMEPIAIGRVIDRLQKAGFVERRADPADRRAWRLYLTPRAHGVVDDMEQISTELLREAQRGVSAAEMKAMMSTLTRMKNNLHALDQLGA
ncbi:MAG: MarR family transcriptional regulator [Xanthomonadales bacterium PRO7]|jgi:DNA-binding MarR family transcriptional regulator|nr:MarR family transcriptional regulator [Xanthomonadales bacterium PRO7]